MRKELDGALCAKYPKIFADRYGDMRETAMCWGFPGDGWYDILDRLCARLQADSDKTGYQVVATQVKEKFGTLRFYVVTASDEQFDAIDEAEAESCVTCEVCGKLGKIRKEGWYKVLCKDHTVLDTHTDL